MATPTRETRVTYTDGGDAVVWMKMTQTDFREWTNHYRDLSSQNFVGHFVDEDDAQTHALCVDEDDRAQPGFILAEQQPPAGSDRWDPTGGIRPPVRVLERWGIRPAGAPEFKQIFRSGKLGWKAKLGAAYWSMQEEGFAVILRGMERREKPKKPKAKPKPNDH